MSRHEIPAKKPHHTCFVGYDAGLRTFFAQVEDTLIQRAAMEAADRVADDYSHGREPTDEDAAACERDAIVFWLGADAVGEVPSVEMLVEQLRPYAEIASALVETLRADQRQAEARSTTAHRAAMQEYVTAGVERVAPVVSEANN